MRMAERNAAFLSRRDLFRKSGAFAATVGFEPYLKYMFPSEPPTTPLPPPSPKATPENPAPVENIAPNPKFVKNGPRDSMNIALTFDACMTQGMTKKYSPDSWHNDKIIQILNDTQTPATFYLCGLYAEMEPDFTRSLIPNPLFKFGQHSFSHPGFEYNSSTATLPHVTSDSQKIAEIQNAQDSIRRITGITPIDFRFPGDAYSDHDIDLVYSLGLTSVGIEVVGADGFNDNPNKIIERVLSQTKPGSIIGLHILGRPNAPVTDRALGPIISGLKDRGFNFVTVPQLANLH